MATARGPSAHQLGQPGLQLGCLRRRPGTRQGPDDARGPAGGLEDRCQQVHRRGLAVGAGDADDHEVTGGLPGQRGGRRSHRGAHRRDLHLGDAEVERPLAEQRHRPGGDGVRSEVVAVEGRTRDTAEEGSGVDPAGIVLGARQIDVVVEADGDIVEGGAVGDRTEELGQQHGDRQPCVAEGPDAGPSASISRAVLLRSGTWVATGPAKAGGATSSVSSASSASSENKGAATSPP